MQNFYVRDIVKATKGEVLCGDMNIPIEMKFSTIVIAVGFSTAIGVFFGIYPARRAAKMQPIDALRSM